MKQTKLIIAIVSLSCSTLYSGENIYLGDTFNQRHSTLNESFVKTTVKSTRESENSSYIEINGKEELREALLSGQLDREASGNKINKEYRYIEIKNARLTQQDLKDMKGDEILIGSRIKNGKKDIEQYISIKNSSIKSDKHINVGIISNSKNTNRISGLNTIERSSLQGGNRKSRESNIDRLSSSGDRKKRESISLIDD